MLGEEKVGFLQMQENSKIYFVKKIKPLQHNKIEMQGTKLCAKPTQNGVRNILCTYYV